MDSLFTVDDDFIEREFILKRISTQKNFPLNGSALHSLTIEKRNDELLNRIIYSIRALIPAEDMKEAKHVVCVKYPDGWWNAFKEQYFPIWLVERYPIKYVTKKERVTFTAYNLYPKFPEVYPECGDARQIIIKYVE